MKNLTIKEHSGNFNNRFNTATDFVDKVVVHVVYKVPCYYYLMSSSTTIYNNFYTCC